MLGKMRIAAMFAAMLGVGLGVNGSAMAGDITDAGQVGPNPYIINSSSQVYLYSGSNAATQSEWTDGTKIINMGPTSSELTIGQSATGSGYSVNLNLKDIKIGTSTNGAGSSILNIVQSADGANKGTVVKTDTLGTLSGKEINIGASGTNGNQNKLIATTFTTGTSTLAVNIGTNSLFQVENQTTLGGAGSNSVTFALGDTSGGVGYLDFKNGMKLANGAITGNANVKGDVLLDSVDAGDSTKTAIEVAGKERQEYLGNVTNQFGTISVKSDANGTASMKVGTATDKKTLSIQGGTTDVAAANGKSATLEVKGTLEVLQGAATNEFNIDGDSASSSNALVTADKLTMESNVASYAAINVNENGKLTIGTKGVNEVDNLKHGLIAVGEKGEAVFNNIVNTSNETEFSAEDGGIIRFTNDLSMNSDTDKITLIDGGIVDFSQMSKAIDLKEGTIDVFGEDAKAVLPSEGMVVSTSNSIKVDTGSVDLVTSITSDPANGKLTIDTKEDAIWLNNGRLGVGDLVITDEADGNLFAAGTSNGVLELRTLTVEEGANVIGSGDVSTTVSDVSSFDGAYTLVGDDNYFNGQVNVNATGQLGTGDYEASMVMKDGETIYVNNGGELGSGAILNIDGKSNLIFNGNKAANTVSGIVNADESDTKVNSDMLVNGTLNTYTYKQTTGTVTSDDTANAWINALDKTSVATMNSANSTFDINGSFAGGLKVQNGATLIGTNNKIWGDQSQTDASLLPVLSIDSKSSIDLSNGDMNIDYFKKVNIDNGGTITIGYDTVNHSVNELTLGDDTNLVADMKNTVKFTSDFTTKFYNDRQDGTLEEFIIEGGTINDGVKKDSWTTSTAFGDFTVTYNDSDAANMGAYVSLYESRDIEDTGAMQGFMGSQFGSTGMNTNAAGNLSEVAQNINNNIQAYGNDDDPANWLSAGTPAGDVNYNILKAIANGDSTYSFTGSDGKTYEGNIGRSTILSRNGYSAVAPMYVVQDSIRNVQNTLNSRLDAFRAVQECVVNECFASDTALGSADILNQRYLNRIWAGGLGTWQNASKRHDYEGYKYSGAGAIVGYDRAFGAAIVGASFAFIDGDFEDKAFAVNNSKIRQHNVNLYGTYNASNGLFFNVQGGYNYARSKQNYSDLGNNYDAKNHLHTLYASAKVGYDIMPCDNFSITPSVGVNYFYTRSNSYDVKENGLNVASIGRVKDHHIELPVEVQVAYEIPVGQKGGLTLMANGGYAYNVRDKGVKGFASWNDTTTGIEAGRIDGRRQGHHSWTAGAGIKFRYDRWDIGVKYDYQGRSKYHSQQVTGTVGYSF